MAWTLHNNPLLSEHMNNEESYQWITSKIIQNEFDLSTCETKEAFLQKWNDIDTSNRIYIDDSKNRSIYRVHRRQFTPNSKDLKIDDSDSKSVDEPQPDDEDDKESKIEMDINCIVKTFDIRCKNGHEISSISELYLLMKHTNLLNCYGLYHDPLQQQLLLTMEPLQMTLSEFVSEYRQSKGWDISEMQCKLIVSYLLYDLWTLHKTGYIHCDINPSNVMLRDRKSTPTLNGWRLIDYDNRLFIGGGDDVMNTKTKGVRGCIEWTPPECKYHSKSWKKKKGKEHDNLYGTFTDIWSMGLLILFVLFGGQQPYTLTEEERSQYMAKVDSLKSSNCGSGGSGNSKYEDIMTSKKRLSEYWYKSKLLRNGKYQMNSTRNEGEIWLRNYLISLYAQKKISRDLFDLLHDLMLVFDPRKRGNAKTVWNHKWFDDYRHLCETMGQ